ncbi:MAG TPA: hypothetical protein EYO96_04375, partial [Candidatus Marinimicrobia bacterium]|nr:hypothetical protein [Candidatus Neomarinimicrobiota bacterium]
VYSFYKVSGFSKNKVIGMAGALDSGRFRVAEVQTCEPGTHPGSHLSHRILLVKQGGNCYVSRR